MSHLVRTSSCRIHAIYKSDNTSLAKLENVIKPHNCDVRTVEADGTVICNNNVKKATTITVDNCLSNEELVIKPNGKTYCRKTNRTTSTKVIVDKCGNNKEMIVNSNGVARCRVIKNNGNRVVSRKGPRKYGTNQKVVYINDDDVNQKIVYIDDDDSKSIVRREVVVPVHVHVPVPVPVPVPAPLPVPVIPAGSIAYGHDCSHHRGLVSIYCFDIVS